MAYIVAARALLEYVLLLLLLVMGVEVRKFRICAPTAIRILGRMSDAGYRSHFANGSQIHLKMYVRSRGSRKKCRAAAHWQPQSTIDNK